MEGRKLIVSINLTDDEYRMYESLADNKYALHIFFNQCEKKLRSQLYVNYHSYKAFLTYPFNDVED